jgi:hypothetical protein
MRLGSLVITNFKGVNGQQIAMAGEDVNIFGVDCG